MVKNVLDGLKYVSGLNRQFDKLKQFVLFKKNLLHNRHLKTVLPLQGKKIKLGLTIGQIRTFEFSCQSVPIF